jgi:hypothetical protein
MISKSKKCHSFWGEGVLDKIEQRKNLGPIQFRCKLI